MSRTKRQRLNADGQYLATASKYDDGSLDTSKGPHKEDDEQPKIRPGRSLFVHSLPLTATAESLTALFSHSFPLKHATVVIDPVTKKSKGYGFVTFADVEDAQRARETFDRSSLDGHSIKVEIAEPRHRQAIAGGSDGPTSKLPRPDRQKANVQPPPKLIVRNLPWTIRKPDQLAALFQSYGKVKHATIPKTKPGLSSGFGFVVLRGRKNAEKALEGLNGMNLEGRTLAVDWAVEKSIWENLQKQDQELDAIPAIPQVSDGSVDGQGDKSLETEDTGGSVASSIPQSEVSESDSEEGESTCPNDQDFKGETKPKGPENNASTLFIRNLSFTCTDDNLQDHFRAFGAIRYARVVLDPATERSKGTAFVCFYSSEDALACLRESPQSQAQTGLPDRTANVASAKRTLLEDTSKDLSGRFTIDGRVLQISRAVDKEEAVRLTHVGENLRDTRDRDKRRLYLLSEGTVSSDSPLYKVLSATEIKIREDSARQRQSLIKSNPTLHLSLTRLSIRNLPRSITSKDLKALAREAVVGFATDVKGELRKRLSREELSRDGKATNQAETVRKTKKKGIVKQAKVVFEGREGGKVEENSGAGRSRGYGFIEYTSHRCALMGLRWLNGHAIDGSKSTSSESGTTERKKRLIAEFAIENAQVVGRRHEKEAKARERSKMVSEGRSQAGLASSAQKHLSKDQTMAKMRKGEKRKRSAIAGTSEQKPATATTTKTGTADAEKASKRQQIIGRKRMMRRSRK